MALGEQFENTYWFEGEDGIGASLVRRTTTQDSSRGPQLTPHTSYDAIQHPRIVGHHIGGQALNYDDAGNLLDKAVEATFDEPEPDRDGYVNQLGEERPVVQGMLFGPYVGTGLKEDPLVPESDREAAARRALRMEDTPENLEQYKRAVASAGLGKVGDKAAKAHRQLAVDALTSSSMPIHEMERMAEMGSAGTIVKPTEGRASYDMGLAGDAGRIILNRGTATGSRVVEVPPRVERKTTRGDALPNPKFWDWFDKNEPSSGSVAFHAELFDNLDNPHTNVVWSNPETGDVLPRDVEELNKHPVLSSNGLIFGTDGFASRDFPKVADALRNAGYVANIYAGKAKELKTPTHTQDIRITGDMSVRYGGDYNTISAHLRHTPASVEEVEVPGTTEREWYKRPMIRGGSKTTVHEMGHAKDRDRLQGADRKYHLGAVVKLDRDKYATNRYGFADPIAEGVADGYADMYGSSAGRDSILLHSAIADPTFAGTHHTRTGYSTEYGNFKTNIHRALYSAVRAHVGMGGSFDELPDRAAIVNTPDLRMSERLKGVPKHAFRPEDVSGVEESHVVNEATLGHIWETMPHVRGHLTTLGYDRIARDAATTNQQHRDQWTRENVGEQLSLEDFEGF